MEFVRMMTKQIYIIPVSITGTLPPRYMPDAFAQPGMSIDSYKVEFLDISVQQRYNGPYRVAATGNVMIVSSSPEDAVNSVIDAAWCKLTDTGVNAILDGVNVNITGDDILSVNIVNNSMQVIPIPLCKSD
ncbi:hypothetical protein [Terasakiella brassicae]|nr:hypothetical protein [Terasakiella brassicae]